jgi:hypothetical protein
MLYLRIKKYITRRNINFYFSIILLWSFSGWLSHYQTWYLAAGFSFMIGLSASFLIKNFKEQKEPNVKPSLLIIFLINIFAIILYVATLLLHK